MVYAAGQTPVPPGMDGRAIVTRDASVVFDPDSLESWRGKPVTIGHPPEPVKVETWDSLARGHIENARRGEGQFKDFLVGDVLVTHPDAIKLADAGCEISAGYDAAYATDGIGRGHQTKVVGNHLAFLPDGIKGRCGELCYVGDQSMDVEEKIVSETPKNTGMAMLRKLLGAKDDAGLQAVMDEAEQQATFDSLNAKLDKLAETVAALVKTKDEDDKKDHKHEWDKDGKCDCGAKKPTEDAATLDAAAVQTLHARTVAAAEILSPGFKVPTVDSAQPLTATVDSICACQRDALGKAYADPKGKKVIEKIMGASPDFTKMTKDQIDARFFAVADVLGTLNNSTITELMAAGLASGGQMSDLYEATRLADERSQKRWAKPGAAA